MYHPVTSFHLSQAGSRLAIDARGKPLDAQELFVEIGKIVKAGLERDLGDAFLCIEQEPASMTNPQFVAILNVRFSDTSFEKMTESLNR